MLHDRLAGTQRLNLCLHLGVNLFDTNSILADDPEGMTILHDREYRVRAYRKADDRILIRGCRSRPETTRPLPR